MGRTPQFIHVVPFGEPVVFFGGNQVACRYPTIRAGCIVSPYRSPLQGTLTEVVRDAEEAVRSAASPLRWNQLRPRSHEEMVLLQLRVDLLGDGGPIPLDLAAILHVHGPLLTADGIRGRVELLPGSTIRGWIVGYVPRDAEFFVVVESQPAGGRRFDDFLLFATK